MNDRKDIEMPTLYMNLKKNPEKTQAHKTLVTLNEKTKHQLEFKFRNMHALIKHNRSILNFMWLNELDKAKGFDIG